MPKRLATLWACPVTALDRLLTATRRTTAAEAAASATSAATTKAAAKEPGQGCRVQGRQPLHDWGTYR